MVEIDRTYMKFLELVSKTDVEELRKKEATYRGSWKKRGGVGAAMMVLRKVDRLENILQDHQWEMFKTPITGEDGTMLAEIRDLRRYLLLVEAEVMALHPEEFPRPGTPADGGQHDA